MLLTDSLRKKKWDHEQETVDKIAQVNITNPHQFWQMIKTLGPREDKGIKLEMMGGGWDPDNRPCAGAQKLER